MTFTQHEIDNKDHHNHNWLTIKSYQLMMMNIKVTIL